MQKKTWTEYLQNIMIIHELILTTFLFRFNFPKYFFNFFAQPIWFFMRSSTTLNPKRIINCDCFLFGFSYRHRYVNYSTSTFIREAISFPIKNLYAFKDYKCLLPKKKGMCSTQKLFNVSSRRGVLNQFKRSGLRFSLANCTFRIILEADVNQWGIMV
jgi:hypothetical protein